VIVAAVIVAMAAAFFVPAAKATSATTGTAAPPTAYTATTVLWNPGAPTIGQGSPITSMDALATIVTLPSVATIAAKELHYVGDPTVLASQVLATVDQTSGFLNITSTAPTAKRAVAVSGAFSNALLEYLRQLNVTQIDQQQKLSQQQIATLQREGADPILIATLKSQLAQLALNRTAPVPITTLQKAVPIPLAPADTTGSSSGGGLTVPKSRTARMILGALLGLLAGLALALVLERFDSRIRSAAAAEKAFGLPVLAEVPAIARRRRDKVVTASHPFSRAADAFRLVGVGTARWSAKPGAKTILVTSPEARDGKTTVAANLAVAHAQAGRRVLVVSCDLRRPAIHESFGVAIQPGLTDALQSSNGNLDLKATLDLAPYVEPCSVVRVGIVPSGVTPDRPGELLGSPKMKQFIERLKKVTDVVILDCAPLVVASDVVPLLPLADGVVLVARAGKTRQELAGNAATLLERLGGTNAGVVLNDAREFSIPLAKRRMYRPTRKMMKAARRTEKTPGFDEPQRFESPVLLEEPPVLDEAPTVIAVDEPTVVETPEVVDQPSVDVQVPDVSPSGGGRGSGSGTSIQASDNEPSTWTTPTPAVTQLLAPERIVLIPASELKTEPKTEVEPVPVPVPEPEPVVPPQPEPVVPPQPEPVVPPVPQVIEPTIAPPSGLGALQQQLVELRKQLEGFQIDGLQLDPPTNGTNGSNGAREDEGAAERG
jgi:capsular exopolysaccharide synthesis family protein